MIRSRYMSRDVREWGSVEGIKTTGDYVGKRGVGAE